MENFAKFDPVRQDDYAFHFKCCIAATLIGILVNYTAIKLGPRDMIAGAPRWNYYVSISAQLFTFPSIVVAAWSSKDFAWDWLEASWDSYPSMKYEWLFIYVLTGYLAKDFLVKMDFLIYVHHVICLLGTIGWIFLPYPGICSFITGTMLLEFGSMSYNLYCMFPDYKFSSSAFFLTMTASNILSFLTVLNFFTSMTDHPAPSRYGFLIVTSFLAFMRQKVSVENIRSQWKLSTVKKVQTTEQDKACYS